MTVAAQNLVLITPPTEVGRHQRPIDSFPRLFHLADPVMRRDSFSLTIESVADIREVGDASVVVPSRRWASLALGAPLGLVLGT